jgi:RNA polymerase sigma factor (sigma-70 family)
MIDDGTLLGTYARERSEDAFGELVQRHLPLVYAAALRRTGGDAHRAKDVAQIVFTTLARDAAALSHHAALTGWLYAATRNAAIDLMRAEQRRRRREEKAHLMEDMSSPEPSADWEQLRPVLDDAMDELDGRDREAVLLRFFEGRPFAVVATALRVSEDAARKRVDRALEKLGALLARRGITSTGGALAVLLANQTTVAAPAGVAASITAAAVAGAGASAAGVGAGIFIMTTSKIVTGVAATVAAIAVGSAIYQAGAARDAAQELASANADRAALRAQLGAAQTRARESEEKLASGEAALAAAKTAPQPAAAPITRPPASQSGPAMDYVLEHPETQPVFLQQQALRLRARYDRFLQAGGLTAEQKEQFLQKMERGMADELDFMSSLHTHGFGIGNLPKDPEGQALFQQLLAEKQARSQELQGSIRELLGDEGFRKLQQYSATLPERNVAEQLAGRLYSTDAPLTGPQAESLMQVLAQNRFAPQPAASPRNTMNGAVVSPDAFKARVGQAMQQGGMNLLDWAAPITDAALAQARTVLSPAQFEVLQQVQAQQLMQFKLAPPPPAADPK